MVNCANMYFTKVANPEKLLPLLESRLPHSSTIHNQILFSKKFASTLSFYTIGHEINSNTWIMSKHSRENAADNICISAPAKEPEGDEYEKIKECFHSSKLIKWETEIVFVAVEKNVSRMIYDINVNLRGNMITVKPSIMYYVDREDAMKTEITSLAENVTVRRLNPETDCDFILDSWGYTQTCDVRQCIAHNASAGVFINGNCVAGAITAEDGLISALFTSEEHRKKGHAKLVEKFLFKELAKDGLVPSLIVDLTNKPSMSFHESLKMKVGSVVDWLEVIHMY